MHRILWIAFTWLFLAGTVGVFGAKLIDQVVRQNAELQIERDAITLRELVEGLDWSEPLDVDPRWHELERELELAAILVRAPSDIAPAEPETVWSRAALNGRRLTRAIEVAVPASRILQVTRVVNASLLTPAWWLTWLGLNLAAIALTAIGIRSVHVENQKNEMQLLPWVAASNQANSDSEILLPWVEDSAGANGTAMRQVGKFVNRSYAEQKAANARGELVLGNLMEGVLAVDGDARVLLVNKSFCRLLNVEQGSHLHRPFVEVVRTPAITNLINMVRKGKPVTEQELEIGSPPAYLIVRARPLPMRKGPDGVLVTVRDETMVKRVELIRREFVANASHELKTPLAAIRLYAETLQLGALNDTEHAMSFVDNIVSQADRLNSLVQGMLQLSRAEVGGALKFRVFDALEALKPCLAGVEVLAKSKGIDLVVDIPKSSIQLESDRDSFQTIVGNLISNATRYTDSGGTVTVRLYQQESEPKRKGRSVPTIVLEVEDTGVGMKQEDLERVFERFFRVQRDRSADTGGTGLGLSMVKHLVQALEGTVSATSEVDKGSKFVVCLPMSRQASTFANGSC